MKKELNDIEKALITRYLSGETSEEETRELTRWRALSAENEEAFRSCEKVFIIATDHLSTAHTVPSIDVNEEWRVFIQNVETKDKPVRKLQPVFRDWMKIAASLIVITMVGAIIYVTTREPEQFTFASNQEIQNITLPDGSTITLNRNSSVSYTSDFGEDERAVKMTGEAFFDVKPDKAHPFVIRAKNTKVEVVGTSFTISAYDETDQVEVIVETGRVNFSSPFSNNVLTLTPGEKGVFNSQAKQLKSGQNTDVNYQSWNTKTIIFDDTDLRTVVETLNKTYHTNITIGSGLPGTCIVTATFRDQSLESVLAVLESTLNLQYRRSGDHIEIIAAGC